MWLSFHVQDDTDAFECSNRSFDADAEDGPYTADESGISIDIEDQYEVSMETKSVSSATNVFRIDGDFDGIIFRSEPNTTVITTIAETASIVYNVEPSTDSIDTLDDNTSDSYKHDSDTASTSSKSTDQPTQ